MTEQNNEPQDKQPMYDDVKKEFCETSKQSDDERLDKSIDDLVASQYLCKDVEKVLDRFFDKNKEDLYALIILANFMVRLPSLSSERPIPKHLLTYIGIARRIANVFVNGVKKEKETTDHLKGAEL